MATLNEKKIARALDILCNLPSFRKALEADGQKAKDLILDVIKLCSEIQSERETDKESQTVARETAEKLKLENYVFKKAIESEFERQKEAEKEGKPYTPTNEFYLLEFRDKGVLIATYFCKGDLSVWLEPIFEVGYRPEQMWCLSKEDQQHIVGFMPMRITFDYISITIKDQWCKRLRDNAGTKNGLELSYSDQPSSQEDLEYITRQKKFIKNIAYKQEGETAASETAESEKVNEIAE